MLSKYIEKILRKTPEIYRGKAVGIGWRATQKAENQIFISEILNIVSKLPISIKVYTDSNIKSFPFTERVEFIQTCDPEKYLVEGLYQGSIDYAIRGNLSAKDIKINIEDCFGIKIHRAVYIEENSHKDDRLRFFLAPVGIDELQTNTEKLEFIKSFTGFFDIFKLNKKILLLGSGRKEDIGRSKKVDDIFKDVSELEDMIRLNYPSIDVYNVGICIEKAKIIKPGLIIPYDGITGNIIYRTLILFSNNSFKAFGAPVIPAEICFIDTSREKKDIYRAFYMALYLIAKRNSCLN